ncbi:MAG TPA: hypothetical protein VGY76_10615 [Solirubrobacteraceae bacterium]|jgi:hypothetical protein|nr:hypothetical protein [Solirubrobacteraceae bacterium]
MGNLTKISDDVIRAVARIWRRRDSMDAVALASEHAMPKALVDAIGHYVRNDWPSVEASPEYGRVQRAHAREHMRELPKEWMFPPGVVVLTPGAIAALRPKDVEESLPFDIEWAEPLIDRHLRGDWGEMDDEDKDANDQAIIHGARDHRNAPRGVLTPHSARLGRR